MIGLWAGLAGLIAALVFAPLQSLAASIPTIQSTCLVSPHLSAGGRLIAALCADRSESVFDALTGRTVQAFAPSAGYVEALAFSADERHVAVATNTDPTGSNLSNFKVWTIGQDRPVAVETNLAEITAIYLSPDGSRLIIVQSAGPSLWDATTGRRIAVLEGAVLSGDPFSSTGATALTQDDATHLVVATDTITGQVRWRAKVSGIGYQGGGWVDKGRLVASLSPSDVSLIDGASGSVNSALRAPSGALEGLAGSLTTRADSPVIVYNFAQTVRIVPLGHGSDITDFQVAPGAESIALVGDRIAVAYLRFAEIRNFHGAVVADAPGTVVSAGGGRLLLTGVEGDSPIWLVDVKDGGVLACFGDGATSCPAAMAKARFEYAAHAADPAAIVAAAIDAKPYYTAPDNRDAAGFLLLYGQSLARLGRLTEAKAVLEEATARGPDVLGDPSASILAKAGLGEALVSEGRSGDALPIFAAAITEATTALTTMTDKLMQRDNLQIALASSHAGLAEGLIHLHRPAEAIPHLDSALALVEPMAAQHADLHQRLLMLRAQALEDTGRFEAATALRKDIADRAIKDTGANPGQLGTALMGLAANQSRLGLTSEAATNFGGARTAFLKVYPADHDEVLAARIQLARLRLEDMHQPQASLDEARLAMAALKQKGRSDLGGVNGEQHDQLDRDRYVFHFGVEALWAVSQVGASPPPPPQRAWTPPPGGDAGRLPGLTQRHKSDVLAVAFSPDGKQIATGGRDKQIIVWDIATGAGHPLEPEGGSGGEVRAVSWNPAGGGLITATTPLLLWNVATGAKTVLDRRETLHAQYSRDGSRIIFEDNLGSVQVLDARTTVRLASFDSPPNAPIAISPNGKVAAIFSTWISSNIDGGQLCLWDVDQASKARCIENVAGHTVTFSPDGQHIFLVNYDTVVMRSVATLAVEREFEGHAGEVFGVAVSADGKKLATASVDKTARIWNLADGKQIARLEGHTDWVEDVDWSPDGRLVASVSRDTSVKLWDASTGAELKTFGQGRSLAAHHAPVTRFVFTADSRGLVTASSDLTAKLWDAQSGGLLNTLTFGSEIHAIAGSADSRRLYIGGTVQLSVFDSKEGALVSSSNQTAIHLRPLPDGTMLSADPDAAFILDDKGGLLAKQSLSFYPTYAAVSKDGRLAAFANFQGPIAIWRLADRAQPCVIDISKFYSPTAQDILSTSPLPQVNVIAFTADGRHLVASTSLGLMMWDSRSCSFERKATDASSKDESELEVPIFGAYQSALVIKLRASGLDPRAIAYSHDAHTALVVMTDGQAALVDVEDGRVIHRLGVLGGQYVDAGFSPNDARVAVITTENALLWDTLSGGLIASFVD